MQNIEFKAELRDLVTARRQCKLLGAEFIGTLRQIDTYFKLPDGRLKKRESEGEPIEWIYYHRSDRVSPRMSVYSILSDDQARRRWGTHSLPRWLTVCKSRELWMLEDVRIHLDQVDELGTFIEFEVIVTREQDVKQCHAALARLRESFTTLMGEAVSVSYSDLMAQLITEQKERL